MRIKLKNPEEFKRLLLSQGFSQKDFAGAVEITPPYFNLILNEERFPSARIAKKISDRLGLDFHDIFFIDDACKSYQN